jgi:hypothetical protein
MLCACIEHALDVSSPGVAHALDAHSTALRMHIFLMGKRHRKKRTFIILKKYITTVKRLIILLHKKIFLPLFHVLLIEMPRRKKTTSRKILLDEKILNQKLNRNLKKLNTEQNNILKQKQKTEKKKDTQ